MEIISKVSKGSRMDQIYIPKQRAGFATGSYVVVKQLEESEARTAENPFFYNINFLEPVKVKIAEEIFGHIRGAVDRYDNILITGSFLEKGFNFNDIDVVLISEGKVDKKQLEESLEIKIGVQVHITLIGNKALIKGLNTDPLYQAMVSKAISVKRFVYRVQPKINYKILDLHLLKSKTLIDGFDALSGREKYEMVRNAVAISLFVDGKTVSKEKVDSAIDKLFGKEMSLKLKENMVGDKKEFLRKYRNFHERLFNKILDGVKRGSEQK